MPPEPTEPSPHNLQKTAPLLEPGTESLPTCSPTQHFHCTPLLLFRTNLADTSFVLPYRCSGPVTKLFPTPFGYLYSSHICIKNKAALYAAIH